MLLLLAAFVAPIGGGQLALDNLPLLSTADVLAGVWGAPEAPILAHAFIAALPCLAFSLLLWKRKIIQVPNNIISALLLLFLGLLVLTIGFSAFRYVSIQVACEWLTYGIAFYAVVAGVGRQRGPREMLAAISLGCTIVALRGILEYAETVFSDPTWRIFAGWVNPNATAAILLIGFFCSMGLVVSSSRNLAAAWGVAAVLCGSAILLTQSKGGLLALAVGGIVLGILTFAWGKAEGLERLKPSLGRIFAVVLSLLMAGMVLTVLTRTEKSGGALARVTNSSGTAEQSAGYRANLWKGAIAMVKERPIGYGIGTYRFESARPGVTPQTHLAHETYLQLAAEASPAALLLFLGVAVTWLIHVFRGSGRVPVEANLLRAGVIASVVAIGTHSLIDSDLYYYGIGLSTFMLLGVGLLLSVDAVAPENMPVTVRKVAAFGSVLLVLLFVFLGVTEVLKGQMRAAVYGGDRKQAESLKPLLQSYGSSDGESWFLISQAAKDQEERHAALETAVQLAPTPRNYRALARYQAQAGELPQAIATLDKALLRDPNNLLALNQKAEYQLQFQDSAAARSTFERLIAVEGSPYFQVRAIPELVPTETYEARVKLATLTNDAESRVELLLRAIEGFKRYRETTMPLIKRMAGGDPGANYAGETLETATRKMTMAADAARQLAKIHREAGDTSAAAAADAEADAFEAVLESSK
jgi:O-antigen ligase/tetratricopeptide (TPR) repeat protein